MKIGENLNYTVGRLRYSSDTAANPTASDTFEITTTTIIIFCLIAAVIALIILVVIIIICVVIKKSKKKQCVAFTGNTDVNMYACPAYGTHQAFTEPRPDHQYKSIDESHEENTTPLLDTASPGNDDNEIDAEGYLKMKPSCEVVDQAITESSVVSGTCSTFILSKSTDDGAKDNKNANDKDDGKDNEGDHDKDDDVKGNKDGDKDNSCNKDQKKNMNAKN